MSQVGDLFVSFLKRKAKIKDTGKIVYGHGGILDRMDGIIFAVPFVCIYLHGFEHINPFDYFFLNEKKNCNSWFYWIDRSNNI